MYIISISQYSCYVYSWQQKHMRFSHISIHQYGWIKTWFSEYIFPNRDIRNFARSKFSIIRVNVEKSGAWEFIPILIL